MGNERTIVKFCAHDECNEQEIETYQTEQRYSEAWEETASDWFCSKHKKPPFAPSPVEQE